MKVVFLDEAQQEFMARFYGSMTEEMTCHQCNMTNGSSSVFTHMSLNITNCKSLADCFNQFFMPEVTNNILLPMTFIYVPDLNCSD